MENVRDINFAEDTQTDIIIPIATNKGRGNAIGKPHGAFSFQIAFAKMLHEVNGGMHGTVDPCHKPQLEHTHPVVQLPERENWNNPADIVSFHARGHRAAFDHLHLLENYNFLPTIAVTQSYFGHPSIAAAVKEGRLKPDSVNLFEDGTYKITDINMDPVWHLDGTAERIGMDPYEFRDKLYEITHYQELVDRPEVPYFLPNIDGPNIHLFGDVSRLANPDTVIAARSHDFCRDGDNYALRCTCAPFKQFAIEEMLRVAIEENGIGILALYPEEGRNLGSVIKHLVYNRRENRPEGDLPEYYMRSTFDVAGGEDARMHWTKADVYRWLLGQNPRITYWLSENPHKKEALERQGIHIDHIVELPKERIPERARTEITAKRVLHGYNGSALSDSSLSHTHVGGLYPIDNSRQHP